MVEHGFKAAALTGGIAAWREAGNPLVPLPGQATRADETG